MHRWVLVHCGRQTEHLAEAKAFGLFESRKFLGYRKLHFHKVQGVSWERKETKRYYTKKNQETKCDVPLHAWYSTQVWALGVWVFSCDTKYFFSYPWLFSVEETFAVGKHTPIFFLSTYFLILIISVISAICEYN